MDDLLDADVEREPERLVAFAKHLVERPLDARQSHIVVAGEADHVGGEAPVRIDARLLAPEIEARYALADHRRLLPRRQFPAQPDEGLVQLEARLDLVLVQ